VESCPTPGNPQDPEGWFFYKVGDTVVVKFCTMDNNSYNFWRDAETQSSNNGNPFGSKLTYSNQELQEVWASSVLMGKL